MTKSIFNTTELSNPQFEMDGLRFITVKSKNLKGRGDICVFVPKGEQLENLPIVTLLHGVYGSAWVWAFLGGAHKTAQRLIEEGKIKPMVLAMPSDGLWGDGSGYMAHDGKDFEKWIAEDVPTAVKENIPQVSEKSQLFISGLSMGGFGALKVGSKYGKQYAGISAHSSITEVGQMELFVEEPLSAYKQKVRANEDAFTSILENRDSLPPLRFDCGNTDELIDYNRTLHQQLVEKKIDHSYEEFEGGHQWEYWQEHLVDTLLFFDKIK
ncbi:alpha/beta hydrolase-fold protein [Flammeovirgaceae bacterium SG7u.111]|nr:alpha/beta hydrolase-fold protein [Flammeovirgaceae bacterium SG7u.132]WPO33843.1 alpha/beta hydrolase-fold protein [Flammeovirgaceae bacterium SG7u.111]